MPGHTKRAAAVPAAWASVQTNRRQTRPPHQPYAQARFCDGGGGPARALRCDRAHSSSARYDCDQVLLASNGGAGYRGGGDDVHRAIDVGAAVVRDPEEIGRLRCDTQAKIGARAIRGLRLRDRAPRLTPSMLLRFPVSAAAALRHQFQRVGYGFCPVLFPSS